MKKIVKSQESRVENDPTHPPLSKGRQGGVNIIYCTGWRFGTQAQITIDVCLVRQTRNPEKCRKCKHFKGAA
jgi:hypothetical protein